MDSVCLFKVFDDDQYKKVTFEITSRCNLMCKHCCVDASKEGCHSLKKEDILPFVSDLKKNGVSDIYVTGGEPFLYPHIELFLNTISNAGFRISLATNATLLTDSWIKLLSQVINKYVLVSIDGHTPDVHNTIRGNDCAWDKAVENIRRMVSLGLKIKVSSIICRDNIEYIERMINNCIERGVHEVYFVRPINVGRMGDNEKMLGEKEKYLEVFDFLKEMKKKYEDVIRVSFKRQGGVGKDTKGCLGGKKLFHINSDLDIFPCSWMGKIADKWKYHTKWSLDNNFSSCIKSLNAFRKVVEERELSNNNGCPALAYINTNDIYGKDPLSFSGDNNAG